jgi:hypothetical protein
LPEAFAAAYIDKQHEPGGDFMVPNGRIVRWSIFGRVFDLAGSAERLRPAQAAFADPVEADQPWTDGCNSVARQRGITVRGTLVDGTSIVRAKTIEML